MQTWSLSSTGERNELSLEDNVLLWGRVPEMLYFTHIGILCMKGFTQQYVWWPKLDCDTETKVKSCSTCTVLGQELSPSVLHSWEQPKQLWSRVHLEKHTVHIASIAPWTVYPCLVRQFISKICFFSSFLPLSLLFFL